MKIICSGMAGYLGSVLAPLLLSAGHEIVAIDNFRYSQISLADCCVYPNFKLIRGDCRDLNVMNELLRDADFFIPLAAIVGAPACDRDPGLAWETNYKAIADHMSKKSCPTIMPTTNSGYGIGGEAACTEDSPLNPISVYGRSKVEAEKTVLLYGGVTLRLATLFGMSNRMRTDLLVNDLTLKALRDHYVVLYEGKARRNYLHVRDAALAIMWAIDHYDEMRGKPYNVGLPDMKGKPYNVGLPDANLTKLELCAKIKEHIPGFVYLESPIGEDIDKRDYLISNERILATGWRPKYSLDDGIRELVKGYEILRTPRWGNA